MFCPCSGAHNPVQSRFLEEATDEPEAKKAAIHAEKDAISGNIKAEEEKLDTDLRTLNSERAKHTPLITPLSHTSKSKMRRRRR